MWWHGAHLLALGNHDADHQCLECLWRSSYVTIMWVDGAPGDHSTKFYEW